MSNFVVSGPKFIGLYSSNTKEIAVGRTLSDFGYLHPFPRH